MNECSLDSELRTYVHGDSGCGDLFIVDLLIECALYLF